MTRIDDESLYDDYDEEPSERELDEEEGFESLDEYSETDWNDRQLGVGGLFWWKGGLP